MFLVGIFLVFWSCIFDITILLLFRMIVGGTRLCVLYFSLLYCCHNHLSLVMGMVMRCLPVFSYICVNSFCMCMVFSLMVMYFSGLHYVTDIWMCGSIVDGGMNLESLFCVWVRCVCTIFL